MRARAQRLVLCCRLSRQRWILGRKQFDAPGGRFAGLAESRKVQGRAFAARSGRTAHGSSRHGTDNTSPRRCVLRQEQTTPGGASAGDSFTLLAAVAAVPPPDPRALHVSAGGRSHRCCRHFKKPVAARPPAAAVFRITAICHPLQAPSPRWVVSAAAATSLVGFPSHRVRLSTVKLGVLILPGLWRSPCR